MKKLATLISLSLSLTPALKAEDNWQDRLRTLLLKAHTPSVATNLTAAGIGVTYVSWKGFCAIWSLLSLMDSVPKKKDYPSAGERIASCALQTVTDVATNWAFNRLLSLCIDDNIYDDSGERINLLSYKEPVPAPLYDVKQNYHYDPQKVILRAADHIFPGVPVVFASSQELPLEYYDPEKGLSHRKDKIFVFANEQLTNLGGFATDNSFHYSARIQQNCSEKEFEFIVGHELTHIKNHDYANSAFQQICCRIAVPFIFGGIQAALDSHEQLQPAAQAMALCNNWYARRIAAEAMMIPLRQHHEFRADKGAARTSALAQGRINLLNNCQEDKGLKLRLTLYNIFPPLYMLTNIYRHGIKEGYQKGFLAQGRTSLGHPFNYYDHATVSRKQKNLERVLEELNKETKIEPAIIPLAQKKTEHKQTDLSSFAHSSFKASDLFE